jgi:radical SAM superfamily enzyme YgiQ (UPF0313 family)
MLINFVCADLEENIGVGILAAAVEKRGHTTGVQPFSDASETERVVKAIVDGAPDVVGLSIQFQHRAPEFLALARRLREAGYRGHVTCGGQFPTLAWRETLTPEHGVDSIVLHDGEETIVELLDALERDAPLAGIPGLGLRAPDGAPFRTEARRLLDDLDGVPFAKRYRHHDSHMAVPFIPIVGGRGCWGKCTYCSIISFYDDAIDTGGGRAVRLRSPDNIAAEMALLLDGAGHNAIFCFHDDNFVFPSEKLSVRRIRAIREALDGYGVGKVALIGKARPDCVTPTLARALADLGVIRLYVGVENGSEAGGDHLRRGTQQDHIRTALASCREAGIFVCYNLLIFEPEATLADVRQNARFIVEHATHPVNFCRAEPYFGTALHTELSVKQDLGGSYLGFNYRIGDDRTELLFRICSAAFRERNFAPNGVANRYMGLGYAANIMRRFFDRNGNAEHFVLRARELTRRISSDTAAFLELAIDLAERVALDDVDTVERETALLGLAIAAADRRWHEELDELYGDMNTFTASPGLADVPPPRPTASFLKLKSSMAVSLSLAVALGGCSGKTVVQGAQGTTGSGGHGGGFVVDPPPPDAASSSSTGTGGHIGAGGFVVDPAPPDDGGIGALEVESDQALALGVPVEEAPRRLRLIDQWFDTSPKATARTVDLPLYDPPRAKLTARREGDDVVVRLEGARARVTTRWEADGPIEGTGTEVRWKPAGPADRVRVAIRARGGIAVLSLRASDASTV